MTLLVVALVLCAALSHAIWNAILRGGEDRLWSITVMCATSAVIALPFVFILTPPARESWPYIAVSALLQVSYCLFLVRAYRHGGLAQVYPIARGTSPLLVTLGAVILAGEALSPIVLTGILAICLAIAALAFEKARPSVATTLLAMVTGGFVAAYTLTDGLGARLSGHAQAYTAWLFLVQGGAMPLVFLAVRGRLDVSPQDPDTRKAIVGGLLGAVSYGVVIWALARAPMGQVSALRETSVLFAAAIGVAFLKEKFTLPRICAAFLVVLGAAMLSAG